MYFHSLPSEAHVVHVCGVEFQQVIEVVDVHQDLFHDFGRADLGGDVQNVVAETLLKCLRVSRNSKIKMSKVQSAKTRTYIQHENENYADYFQTTLQTLITYEVKILKNKKEDKGMSNCKPVQWPACRCSN